MGLVPGSAPLPPQVWQRSDFGTVTVTWVPLTAWSKLSRISVSRSRPRADSGSRPPPRLKIVEKMSPRSEAKRPPAAGASEGAPARPDAAEHAAGVVLLPLLGVRQRVVCLLDLLEALLGGLVAGVPVRVVLARKLPVGLLDLLFRGLPGDAERRVEVGGHGYSLTTTRAARITWPSRR